MTLKQRHNSFAAPVDKRINRPEGRGPKRKSLEGDHGTARTRAARPTWLSSRGKVIDEIAFQTNILAAERCSGSSPSGEAGMGFAVVAEEVGNLAAQRPSRQGYGHVDRGGR